MTNTRMIDRVGRVSTSDVGAGVARIGARRELRGRLVGRTAGDDRRLVVFVVGTPDAHDSDDRDCGQQRRDDVRQRNRHEVRRGVLGEREHDPADDCDRPRLAQAAPAIHDGDQREGDEQRQDRRLPPDHRAEGVARQPADLAERDDRGGHRAERDGCGVGGQREYRRLQRLETESDQHDRGDGHRSAEAGQRLHQGPERERDEDRLDALVVADRGERAPEHIEVAGRHGHLVHPDRVDDDPQDRKESECRALRAGKHRLADRHAVHDDRDDERNGQRDQRGHPCGHPQHAEQDEQQDQRDRRNQGTPSERVHDGIEDLLVHGGRLSVGRAYPGWGRLTQSVPSCPGHGQATRGWRTPPHPARAGRSPQS